jgi:septum formation protein
MDQPALVLASTSPYRRDLLARLGLPFTVAAPACDEDAVKAEGLPVEALTARLARLKAASVAAPGPRSLIIGSDQAAEIDGEILGKPGTPEAAEAQLARLAGREHRLVTAVALRDPASGEVSEALDVHRLTLRPLTAAEIRRYVARDRPLDCAGAYRIEGLGITLFASIAGADFTAIVGLPLLALTRLLRRHGVSLP